MPMTRPLTGGRRVSDFWRIALLTIVGSCLLHAAPARAQSPEPQSCRTVHLSDIGWTAESVATAVFAKLLTDLVMSLPNQRIDLQLSAKDRTLKVTCGGSRSSIKGIDADEFPVVAAIGDAPATSADARQLRDALSEVVFAAASDESRARRGRRRRCSPPPTLPGW